LGTLTGERPEAVRVWLLGGFRVSVGPRTIEEHAWRLKKAAALVKLLALTPGHRLHREQVMDLLWPDSGRRAASNSLRRVLHGARRVLDPAAGTPYLASENESLALCPAGDLWVDVESFEEAARAARRSRDPAAYRAAIELFAGDLLPEDRYEEWAEKRRGELRRTLLSLHLELARLYEERGEYERGIEALLRAATEQPTNEEVHAGLMRLYAFSGRRVEALGQYERLREALARDLGASPEAATRRLREDIAAGRFPEARRPGPPLEEPSDFDKHNLPATRTSFVGREREMVEIKRTLAMTRLLTLTGAGGSGKARLALEVARDLVGAYPDGVWLVELAPLSQGEMVPRAVTGALGVQEQPGRSLTSTLTEALRQKDLLLILDNCEHLVEDAARLVDVLLDSCPRLRVLATSREPLGVAGEVRWMVPALSVPEAQRSPTVVELEGNESARLFVDRASKQRPGFALTAANCKTLAEICRRLDGLPLAIELAAARVSALSVEQILQRLESSLKLLASGGRTGTSRQRTLRGALDWSYDLLAEREQTLFRRLSIFAGGWTLEAAEAVGTGDGVEEEDVTDLLSGLVDKSLVVAEASPGAETSHATSLRYRMLEPVRQYARERLEEGDEGDAVRRRHAMFFLVLAEEAEPAVEWAQQQEWLERLETEHANLRAVLQWSLEQGENTELGLRMGAALGEFWYLLGHFGEGRRWLEEALAKSGPAPRAARARALYKVSWLAFLQGDLDRALRASEEGLRLKGVELLRTADGDSVAAKLKRMLGIVVANRGEVERAMGLFEEGLALSRAAGSVSGAAHSLLNLGIEWRVRGDFGRSTEFYEEALALCRESGTPSLLAIILSQLGLTLLLQGDLERATATSNEAATMFREQKHRFYLADALTNLRWSVLLRGDSERAEALFAETLGLRRELGDKLLVPYTLRGLASVAAARGEAGRPGCLGLPKRCTR
jgi:predicted ATPase/DNA-binding SARP family transcriptional activator